MKDKPVWILAFPIFVLAYPMLLYVAWKEKEKQQSKRMRRWKA